MGIDVVFRRNRGHPDHLSPHLIRRVDHRDIKNTDGIIQHHAAHDSGAFFRMILFNHGGRHHRRYVMILYHKSLVSRFLGLLKHFHGIQRPDHHRRPGMDMHIHDAPQDFPISHICHSFPFCTQSRES
ncbi:hypothetical protein SDC9_92351 [bioreactor metagenome]|uniref:Uncharacterized protein n=1 Tax=bioreactor metagenome TaxID=1076179 RepID=A0A645A0A9_9ZZZZ